GLLAALIGPLFILPGFWGMAGPLAMGILTVELVTWKLNHAPQELTGLMIRAFGMKMVFYAAYVVVILKFTALDGMTFILSFLVFFILLHILEALYFHAKFETR
ncbi:MAG: hypothetical protein ACE5D1_05765, partial [Fidelibacterota bacterium]